jgi:chromosome segregation ATPase
MSDPGDLERRVAALEQEVARIQGELDQAREDTAAARVLATGADRDVSDVRSQLRAQRGLLQALRDSQIEHGTRLDRLERRMDLLEARMTTLEDRIAGMDARLTGRLDELTERLAGQSGRMDALEAEMRRGFAEMRVGMAHIVTLLERDSDD